jgi:hypothetical protein
VSQHELLTKGLALTYYGETRVIDSDRDHRDLGELAAERWIINGPTLSRSIGAVRFVALLNLGYFEIEFVVARAIAARCVGFTAVAR